MPARRPRLPGRPASEHAPDARAQLLEAASRLFARHDPKGVSLRQVAAEAGVTPAMVHYYFGGKEGLYDAMLERTLGAVIERVTEVASLVRDDADRPDDPVADVLEVVIGMLASEPWLPALVVREVMSEDGRLRDVFIRTYASKMAELLPGWMRRDVEAGRFRSDLDPQLAFISFMGMALIPFVARPVIERVLGVEYDDAFLRRFAAHTRRLFIEGAEP